MKPMVSREQMNIVIVGHVDHGKSTIIGRLLADTHSLPEGKLEQIKAMCELNSKPFEYAFLLDALKDERSQGITIDSARVFFKTQKRDYIIIDAPGHIEFLKNMVSGASRAEAALLVIDANEGIQENSRRHGYMLSMLGISQIAVLINKMDLVGYGQKTFEYIKEEFLKFLKEININPLYVLPVSGREGDNIASLNGSIPWYKGKSLLDILDGFKKEKTAIDKPFRMPVQDIYKFTNVGDTRRIVAGTVESGKANVGDEIVFYPSGKKSKIKSIEAFNADTNEMISVGKAAGFTLSEQIYITRGEVATKSSELMPSIAKRIRVSLFWLGKKSLVMNKDYYLKIGTSKVGVRLEEVNRVINASDLSILASQNCVDRNDVAECVLILSRAIAFDISAEALSTSRFVIVDEYEIAGGGIIRETLEDKYSWVRDKVIQRNIKWEKSHISTEERTEKYNQKAALVLITGTVYSLKKDVAKELETTLFQEGKIAYYLGIGNVLHGVDADLNHHGDFDEEHFRRLSEIAHILLDAGIILIVTARELTQDNIEIIKTTVNIERIHTIWVGKEITTDINVDLQINGNLDLSESMNKIKSLLIERGIIFNPW